MKRADLPKFAVPVLIVGIILLLILPVPPFLLDVLIICNILLALVILLTTLFVKKPLDFSVFPSLLLVATLFRLGLNVASTRLVLAQGFAGDVIQAFGHVAVAGSVIIGAVIFLILVVIQFVVVTKGAERVAEVGARFTLDAMPGKQMAIDADLNAGLITDVQAKERRAAVSAEADFYGAMDGASKFVKGDAIAGILILVINLVGGIAIGMLQNGMSITDALSHYGILTIGDGLVSQIPALLMAVSTGMIVTRSGAESDIGTSASDQLSQSRTALMIAGAAAIAMGFIPGMPILPFLLIGAALLFTGWRIGQNAKRAAATAAEQQAIAAAAPPSDTPEDLLEQMRVHALEILLAPDLVDMVSGASDDLLGRVRALRRKIAVDMGIVVPPVRTRDSIDLPPSTYAIRIAGVEAGRGTAPARSVLALGEQLDGLPGDPTVEPVFGLAGKWVPAELRHAAEMTGATVIDRVSVLVTHLQAVIGDNAARLLTREDVKVLAEGVKQVNPAAVEELVPGMLSMAELQRVLQGLLAERVPINDLGRICEALTLRAKVSTDPEGLVESARAALGPALAARHLDGAVLRVIMIDPVLEQAMLEGLRPSEQGTQILLDAHRIEQVLGSVRDSVRAVEEQGLSAVLVCAPQLRPAVHRMVSAQANGLPVLSYQEATAAGSTIETVGVVRAADPIAA
ncbi:EscV/YscV/HrcV family type III secretion system export apparatus protein [Curtobacterium sp. MCJR17_055]|uniref:flagellar biosynthesis protein FlhA n=1 Tax=unclassified Curtobacterium TaxID=257496 RepID=UPI000D8A9EB8|nr:MULTISPECIES: flagellar biosynthesis protein FlhA [unclassified Curtobacterium]PYY32706.1 EscV/YscV/HrcV family type III secretion system export apparatus protein [Curtobacterium sp. MCBD17_029]PYY50962.1 EscV/YscV/HrcV family type III secretion system export apparatus protein [Curtobacterium sp. MCBD17_023]PYY55730.1 EscV/YscV/HrcV family type III secretion system export apparatus protein [Curtobacterium sp. MCJR17_055]PYY60474.1 EscV/YscV/HrcV family type III secretion system export appara